MTVNRGKLVIAPNSSELPKKPSAASAGASGLLSNKNLSTSSLFSGESNDSNLPSRCDFGFGFGCCSICSAPRCLNRGCGETKQIICAECWPAYVRSRSFVEPASQKSSFYGSPRGATGCEDRAENAPSSRPAKSKKPKPSQTTRSAASTFDANGFPMKPSVGSWLMPLPRKLKLDVQVPVSTSQEQVKIEDEALMPVSATTSFMSNVTDTDDDEVAQEPRNTIVDVDAFEQPEKKKQSSDAPQTPKKANRVTVTFQPGTLGITFSEDTVTGMTEGGQARQQNIEVGWRIRYVNGKRCKYFGDPQLQDAVCGSGPFTIAFDKPKVEKVMASLQQEDLPTIREDEESCVPTPKVAPNDERTATEIQSRTKSREKDKKSHGKSEPKKAGVGSVDSAATSNLLKELDATLEAQEREAEAVLASVDEQAHRLSENAAQLKATKDGLAPVAVVGDLDRQLDQIKVAGQSTTIARSQVKNTLKRAEEVTKATAASIAENDAKITDLEAMLLQQENEAVAALAAVEEKAKAAASRIEKLEEHRHRSISTPGGVSENLSPCVESLDSLMDEQQARTDVREAAQDKEKLQEEIFGLQKKLETVVEGKKTVSSALQAMEEREKQARARIQALESTIATKEDDLTKNMTIANEMIRHLKKQQEEKDAEFERFKITMEEAEEHEAFATMSGCVSNSWISASFCATHEMPRREPSSGNVSDWFKRLIGN